MIAPDPVRLRVHFPFLEPDRRTVAFAFVCGQGAAMEGDYVFVDEGSLDRLRIRGANHFESVPTWETADLACYPHNFEAGPITDAVQDFAASINLPCVFFRNVDRPPTVKLKHGVVFQESIFASRRTSSELPHPAVVEDLLNGGPVKPRIKRETPVVGFRGFPGSSGLRDLLKRVRHGRDATLGSYLRRSAMAQCRASALVDTRFESILYDWRLKNVDPDRDLKIREAYIRNMLDSDYILAIRGRGNFSYRLYEALCFGRIPVMLNTDSLMPLADSIDWRRHGVWIDPPDFGQIPDRIREFHESLTEADYVGLQQENRLLWESVLDGIPFWNLVLREVVENFKRRQA